jgi:hypothetical protein
MKIKITGVYDPLTDGTYYERSDAIPGPQGFSGQAVLLTTCAKAAELIKHGSNAFLAMKISFINAVASICEVVGADIEEIGRGIGADSRIGERFLRPGIAYGGSCFPKDLLAFRLVALECGHELGLLDEVIKVTEGQKRRFVRKVRNAFGHSAGSAKLRWVWRLREARMMYGSRPLLRLSKHCSTKVRNSWYLTQPRWIVRKTFWKTVWDMRVPRLTPALGPMLC